ncbi:RDD family protein [Paludibacterium yongneupense]|uniref:RDD family protein n=1 Tax=Paludibacterium yongneupense TaxID=400061 RepID=UPI00042475A8|nr:RDD family protein [Paludibacterium yongneupense]
MARTSPVQAIMSTAPNTRPGLARCAACLCYESLLLIALLLVATALFTALAHALGPLPWQLPILRLLLLGVVFAYFGLSWVKNGQTVAMKAWGIRLVGADGAPLGWRQAGLRFAIAVCLVVGLPALAYAGSLRGHGHASAPLALLWGLATFVFGGLDPQRRFLHDRLAGTRLQLVPKRTRGVPDQASGLR